MTEFFVSDTHFHHGNILAFEPWRQTWARNVSEMNDAMIDGWNSVVAKTDTVFHLGDFSFGNEEMIKSIVTRLNGSIHLILGNHDRSAASAQRCGMKASKNVMLESDYGHVLHCRHDPRKFTAQEVVEADFLLHGHLHGLPHHDGMDPLAVSKLFDVGVDAVRRITPLSKAEVSEILMRKKLSS